MPNYVENKTTKHQEHVQTIMKKLRCEREKDSQNQKTKYKKKRKRKIKIKTRRNPIEKNEN